MRAGSSRIILLVLCCALAGCDRAPGERAADVRRGPSHANEKQWESTQIPVEARYFWRSASDRKRFVLWGGQAERGGEPCGAGSFTDGALFEGGTWKVLPPADIKPRVGSAFILAGDRLVVWGGSTWVAWSPSDQLLLIDVPQHEVPEQEHAAPPEHKEGYLNDGAVCVLLYEASTKPSGRSGLRRHGARDIADGVSTSPEPMWTAGRPAGTMAAYRLGPVVRDMLETGKALPWPKENADGTDASSE